jgi:hypothetical protein
MGSSFEDLEVWKNSCRLSVRLYKLLVTVYGLQLPVNRKPVTVLNRCIVH